MNKVILIGNVGTDPLIRYIDSGVCVATFRMATTERGYTLQNGTQVPEQTEWHNVVLWRSQAEFVEKYVHKGDKVCVEGKIRSRRFIDKQGVEQTRFEIEASQLEFLSRRLTDEQKALAREQRSASYGAAAASPSATATQGFGAAATQNSYITGSFSEAIPSAADDLSF